MTIGSGDNRARSALGEYAGYDAPGTLFVSFDMRDHPNVARRPVR